VTHSANEKQKKEIQQKNDELNKPLEETKAIIEGLSRDLKNYDKDKASLRHARARLSTLEEQYKQMQVAHELLLQQYRQLEDERDTLYTTFEDTVIDVQRRSAAKNQVLEKMLDEYQDIFEAKKVQFTSVLRASGVDTVVLHNVTKKLDDVLSAKNDKINELKYEHAKAMKVSIYHTTALYYTTLCCMLCCSSYAHPIMCLCRRMMI
jgi:DNA repair exonuclease SbcCD ATPase subunit